MIKKHFYFAPEAEILVAKFERNILSPLEGGDVIDPFSSNSSTTNASPQSSMWHWMEEQ